MIRTWVFWFLGLFPHVTIRREGGKPYLTRYCLLGGSPYDTTHPWLPFNLFLHCFHASDEETPHNHPWRWARSLILAGSYREHRQLRWPTLKGAWLHRTFNPGDVNAIDDETFHYVTLQTPTVWTLFLGGKKVQTWGFLEDGTFSTAREFLSRKPGATSNVKVIDG